MAETNSPEMVNLTIDGRPVRVPKGTNLIEAAKTIGIEIPHYCYHKNLSIAGNCRMCQVQVKGAPKLDIGCNTLVREGMEVSTHLTSKAVDDAQAATLEFLLINHPLDCTVCDQAGHCKLQDYHFEYNARPSRFLEEKVHKVKAVPVGPHVMLDGERCILCTRCVRFCDEVTKTSELGVLNRGDRSVIAVNEGRVLDNPLSGTVVDLCPVGALTHRDWRFNTRIWFTKQTDTICPGCSTGCNAKVAVRDGSVVQVKARENQAVNKEWMCDEGRYGFQRFLPRERVVRAAAGGAACDWEGALKAAAAIKGQSAVVFLEPQLLLEEFWVIKQFAEKHLKNAFFAVQYRERRLTETEAILISPDYAPNFRSAEFLGLVPGDVEGRYHEALRRMRAGDFHAALFVGDRSVLAEDVDLPFLNALSNMKPSVAILCDADAALAEAAKVVFPGRSVLEKSGLMINRALRLQYADRVVEFPRETEPAWRIVNKLGEKCGAKLVNAATERDLTTACLAADQRLKGLKISAIKQGGVSLAEPRSPVDGAGQDKVEAWG